MPEAIADPWPEILAEAIDASTTQPVLGTYFRAAVNFAASKRDMRFPLGGEPELRFIQLLERYPQVVTVLRRPKQDFLVAAAGKEGQFVERMQERFYRIRPDLFHAFTIVSDQERFYDTDLDGIVWRRGGEEQPTPNSRIQIETPAIEDEIKLRRDFSDTVAEPSRSALLSALESHQPLQHFGKTVKERRIQSRWHGFRMERMVQKIQSWAKQRNIEWKDAWLIEAPPVDIRNEQNSPSESAIRASGRCEVDPLQILFSGLDASDIRRISIPLDLVLKALTSLKKR